MRKKFEEAEGEPRGRDQMGAESFPDRGPGRGAPGEESDEEENEARPARAVKEPGEVTSKEIEQHRLRNHLPFRSWCPYCLAAKGKERPHVKGSTPDLEDGGGSPVGVGLWFLLDENEKGN